MIILGFFLHGLLIVLLIFLLHLRAFLFSLLFFLLYLVFFLLNFRTWCDYFFTFLFRNFLMVRLLTLQAAIDIVECLLRKFNNFRLYLIKDFPNYWLRVEPVDAVIELSLLVVNGSVGERSYPELLAKLGIPVAVEVVYGKGPLILVFELIENVLEVAAVDAVGCEELYYLVGICLYHLPELDVTDQTGVWHEPLFALDHSQNRRQQQPLHPAFIIHSCRVNAQEIKLIDISDGDAGPICRPLASSPSAFLTPNARLLICLSCLFVAQGRLAHVVTHQSSTGHHHYAICLPFCSSLRSCLCPSSYLQSFCPPSLQSLMPPLVLCSQHSLF